MSTILTGVVVDEFWWQFNDNLCLHSAAPAATKLKSPSSTVFSWHIHASMLATVFQGRYTKSVGNGNSGVTGVSLSAQNSCKFVTSWQNVHLIMSAMSPRISHKSAEWAFSGNTVKSSSTPSSSLCSFIKNNDKTYCKKDFLKRRMNQ